MRHKKKPEPIEPKLELFEASPNYIGANTHFGTHAHSHHELVTIQQGRYRSRVSGKEHIAVYGDVLLYTAGKVHEEWAEDGAPVLTWACKFYGSGVKRDEPVFRHDTHGRVQERVSKLFDLWYTNEVNGGMSGYYLPVLEELLEEFHKLPSLDSNPMVDQIRAFVRSRLADEFTVKGLADVVGLSRTHFARQYRALAGHSPMKDVQFLRIEEAVHLISTGTMPLHEIAPMVGIANEYHLSRLIKECLGIGVRELRHSGR